MQTYMVIFSCIPVRMQRDNDKVSWTATFMAALEWLSNNGVLLLSSCIWSGPCFLSLLWETEHAMLGFFNYPVYQIWIKSISLMSYFVCLSKHVEATIRGSGRRSEYSPHFFWFILKQKKLHLCISLIVFCLSVTPLTLKWNWSPSELLFCQKIKQKLKEELLFFHSECVFSNLIYSDDIYFIFPWSS